MSWGAQNRSKDAKTPNIGPAMSEKPIFYQLFNKLTPRPARPADLKHAQWKPGIKLLSVSDKKCFAGVRLFFFPLPVFVVSFLGVSR
jgi:hypothetical protein